METTSHRLNRNYHSLTGRPNHLDPAWRQMIHAAFARTLGPWLPSDRHARILDVGCGEGALLAFLRERGYDRLDGFDSSPENVGMCLAQHLDFVREANALTLAQMKGEYDLILAIDLLEHLPKDDAVGFLEGTRQRLAPGGSVIIQTPNLGSVLGTLVRYGDLTHEFGLTEVSAGTLLRASGFEAAGIEIRPAWNATTWAGRCREWYLRALHLAIFLGEGSSRPRIPTKNLLIRARRS